MIPAAAMSVTLAGLYGLLVLGASLQSAGRARQAFVSLVPFAVAVASFAVYPGSLDPRAIGDAARAAPSAFFVVNAGLLLLGAAVAAGAGIAAVRDRSEAGTGAARGLLLLGAAIVALWFVRGLASAGGWWRSVLAGAGVATIGMAAGAIVRRLRRDTAREAGGLRWPGLPGNLPVATGFGLGALAMLAGPRVSVVFLGLAVAAAADFADRHGPRGGRPWLLVAVAVLAPVWWLMSTIAGPVGLRIADLANVPLSPRAEILLALPVGLVAWACFALWPAHRLFPGGLFAALGAVLWLRVAGPAFDDGLRHWQPVLVPLGTLGVWGLGVTGRGAGAVSALAFVTLASGGAESGLVALLLVGASLTIAWSRAPERPAAAAIRRLGWASASLLLPAALEAGFRSQVTYTLAAAIGFTLAIQLGFSAPSDHHLETQVRPVTP